MSTMLRRAGKKAVLRTVGVAAGAPSLVLKPDRREFLGSQRTPQKITQCRRPTYPYHILSHPALDNVNTISRRSPFPCGKPPRPSFLAGFWLHVRWNDS